MRILGQELSKRETVLVAVTLVVAVGSGLFWLSKQVGTAEESPEDIRAGVTIGTSKLRKSLKEAEDLRKEIGLHRVRLPSTEDLPQVHLHVRTTAQKCGLGFSSLTASTPRVGKGVCTVDYRFTANSELKSLVKFADEIQSGEYLICLESWDMKPMEDPKNVQTDISLRAYFQPEKKK